MQNMIVKSVDVLGNSIMAVKNKDGYVYAGISYFCSALGMSRDQKNRQVANVQKDETLKQGCIKLGAGVLDEGNEAIALRIDFIPLWLAKINITQKTREERPDFAEKLLEYQLKAKDILAAAFLPDNSIPNLEPQISTGTNIRLYRNNQWGILDMGGELYTLTPDEFSMVAKLIPALNKNGVNQVPLVITTMLGISGRSGKLEYVGMYTCHDNKHSKNTKEVKL